MAQIVILDIGSQYGHLIDKRVRELNYQSDILPLDTSADKLKGYKAIIISGGSNSVYEKDSVRCDIHIFDMGIPIMGLCYGFQLMNYLSGGTITHKYVREDGKMKITVDTDSPLFKGLDSVQTVLLTHGDSIDKLSSDYKIIAQSPNAILAIEHLTKKIYGVQFHPEVDLTINGKLMFKNFLSDIAHLIPIYNVDNRLSNLITNLKMQIGDKHVLILVSGGVDSTVCMVILHQAIPKNQIHALYIDHGFMRLNESQFVQNNFKKYGFDVKIVTNIFLNSRTEIHNEQTNLLSNTTAPEEKRKIIGDTFMRVTDAYLEEINLTVFFLVQGTLRAELIESASTLASGKTNTIKTHHNDTLLVRQKRALGLIIEPFKNYHKNEVRDIGRQLGLAEELIIRQPFPGPGLAVRILCTDQPYLDSFDIINEKLKKFCSKELYISLLPIKSVGVTGDCRKYDYVCAISGKPNWKKLFLLAKLIPQTIQKINRIVYVFKKIIKVPIKTIVPTFLNNESLDQLKLADYKVNKILDKNIKLVSTISQMPIVLIPISLEGDNKRSIVIRPVITLDFMTGVSAIPNKDISDDIINKMVDTILEDVTISSVMYDLTDKPPGAIEWE